VLEAQHSRDRYHSDVETRDLMHKYEIIIQWSDEDEAYVADVPELPGCMAHGSTYEAAAANVNEAIQLWIDTAKEIGDPIPESKGQRLTLA
jgi:predicted RNase H-like HicB family nuclease